MMVGRWCGGSWGCVTAGGVDGGSGGYSGGGSDEVGVAMV
ncbi:hypothetical protein Tco_0696427, partial [Tanacetum coccineum]